MSEICFDCLNEVFGGKEDAKNYVLSKSFDLCESCGEYKRVVITKRNLRYYARKFRSIIYPLLIVLLPLILLSAPVVRAFLRKKSKNARTRHKKNGRY